MQKTILVGIDWQNDFVEPSGSLYVANAERSANRFKKLVEKLGGTISDITLTLDSHQPMDIAHPPMFRDKQGNPPPPFTVITTGNIDVEWFPTREPWKGYTKQYVQELEDRGRFSLMIWPEHCIIGTEGANLQDLVAMAAYDWARVQGRTIQFLTKGSNPFTEHYSAVAAEVPFMGGSNGYQPDPGTQTNMAWINMLRSYDRVLFTGQALSHCVRFTLTDTIEQFGEDAASKIIIVRDCMDPVVTPAYDYTQESEDWLKEVEAKGIQVVQSTDL